MISNSAKICQQVARKQTQSEWRAERLTWRKVDLSQGMKVQQTNANRISLEWRQWSGNLLSVFVCVCVRCFGEDTCLSIPDVKAVVMVLPPSEPRITITGSNRLVRPASDLQGPLGVAPFKELHITSTVMKGDSVGGCEWRSCTWFPGSCPGFTLQLMNVLINPSSIHTSVPAVHRTGVMEVMHNLDYCDILVIGEELSPDAESLEIHHNALLGKHLDATNSTSGISIYGGWSFWKFVQEDERLWFYLHSMFYCAALKGNSFSVGYQL